MTQPREHDRENFKMAPREIFPQNFRSALCEYVIHVDHTKLAPCPVILQVELGIKLIWHPLSFG